MLTLRQSCFGISEQMHLSRGFPEQDFARAVVTVPVNMRGKARQDLRAGCESGRECYIHQFVHEPMAALYGYLRGMSSFRSEVARLEGRIVMVFDWGGGTLDLTLCKIEQGTILQILNVGEPSAGGDQFDLRVSESGEGEASGRSILAADWGRLQPNAEARLLKHCEDAKIRLSESEETTIYLSARSLQGHGERPRCDSDAIRVAKPCRRSCGEGSCNNLPPAQAGRVAHRGNRLLPVVTGGMVAMPAIREGLIELLGGGRVREIENAETVISEGASWIAHDGLRVRLAKPIEVLNCHDVYVQVIGGVLGSTAGRNADWEKDLTLLCRSTGWIRQGASGATLLARAGRSLLEDRLPYACLCVDVDTNSQPLQERLDLEVVIDDNLIANVGVRSMLSDNYKEVEIHDLEFGLGVAEGWGDGRGRSVDAGGGTIGGGGIRQPRTPGEVRIRGNVAVTKDDWGGVPGEIVGYYRRGHTLSRRQRDEKMYYSPCVGCGRNIYLIERDGCDRCSELGLAASAEETQYRRSEL